MRIHWSIWLVVSVLIAGLIYMMIPSSGCSPVDARTARTRQIIRHLDMGLSAYQRVVGSLPTGNQQQVIAQLHGDNPRQELFIGIPKSDFGPKGEIADGWKTPIRIILNNPPSGSGTNFSIRSAGRDRKFDTPDDLVPW